MALPIFQDEMDPEFYKQELGNQLERTWTESLSASWDQGQFGGAGDALNDMMDLRELRSRSDRVIPADELNEKYKSSGHLFREAMPNLVAQEIVKRKMVRDELERNASMGPNGFLTGNFAASTLGGITGGFINPIMSAFDGDFTGALYRSPDAIINIGAAIIGGPVGARAAMGLSKLPVVGSAAARLAGTGLGSAVTRAAVEGAVGGVPSVALMQARDAQEGQDFSMTEAIGDWAWQVGVSVGFGAVGHGAGKAWTRVFSSEKGGKAAVASAVSQAMNDKRPNMDWFERIYLNEQRGVTNFSPEGTPLAPDGTPIKDFSGRSIYQYSKVDPGSVTGKFFSPSKFSTENMIEAGSGESPFDTNFGNGFHLTDDPLLANNVSSSNFNDIPGKVYGVDVDKLKLLDTEARVPEPIMQRIRAIANQASIDIGSASSMKELEAIISKVSTDKQQYAEAWNTVNQVIRGEGYDGYLHPSEVNGSKRNVMTVFEESSSKLKQNAAFEPDSKLTKINDQDVAADIKKYNDSKESEILYSPQEDADYVAAVEEGGVVFEDPELEAQLQTVVDEANDLVESGSLSKAEMELVGNLMGVKTDADTVNLAKEVRTAETIVKAAMVCVGRS